MSGEAVAWGWCANIVKAIKAGLGDDDIDRLIKQAQREVALRDG